MEQRPLPSDIGHFNSNHMEKVIRTITLEAALLRISRIIPYRLLQVIGQGLASHEKEFLQKTGVCMCLQKAQTSSSTTVFYQNFKNEFFDLHCTLGCTSSASGETCPHPGVASSSHRMYMPSLPSLEQIRLRSN